LSSLWSELSEMSDLSEWLLKPCELVEVGSV